MKRSIRKAPKKKKYTATPPFPRYHGNSKGGLRAIFFSYNPQAESVDIGPVFKRRESRSGFKKGRSVRYVTNKPVTRILNQGGTVKRITRFKGGKTFKKRIKYRKFDFASRALIPTAAKMNELVAQHGLI